MKHWQLLIWSQLYIHVQKHISSVSQGSAGVGAQYLWCSVFAWNRMQYILEQNWRDDYTGLIHSLRSAGIFSSAKSHVSHHWNRTMHAGGQYKLTNWNLKNACRSSFEEYHIISYCIPNCTCMYAWLPVNPITDYILSLGYVIDIPLLHSWACWHYLHQEAWQCQHIQWSLSSSVYTSPVCSRDSETYNAASLGCCNLW